MRKRQKFVLTAILLALGIAAIQIAPLGWRYGLVAFLAALSWVLAGWSLKEGLSGVEWLTVPLPMALYTAGMGFFFILLPSQWWWSVMVLVLFGVGQYALLLTANIFSVAAIRTIALFRAASAVGFVMTLATGFLLYNSLLSFRLASWANGVGVALISLCLLVPALWSSELAESVTRRVWFFGVWLAILIGLLAVGVSFWPVSLAVGSLFLTTALYVYLGISQHHFSSRLSTRTMWEYVTVGLVVLVTMLVTAG
ncbi:MAG: hypothetical protein Q7S31_01945 [bacterium]|nr:hypothetical protein [bacterium]